MNGPCTLEAIRQELANYGTLAEVARQYGMSRQTLSDRYNRLLRAESPAASTATHSSTKPLRILYYSDIHGNDHQNHAAVERMLDHMASEEWDHVIDGGDRIDAYSVSRYDKDPKRIGSLPAELAWSREFSKQVEARAGSATLHFTRGNHEQRIPDYLRRKAPELEGLAELSLQNLMGLDGWNVHGREGVVINGMRFYHGDYTAKGAGNSVRKALDALWQSVVQGHCHRQAIVRTRKHTEFVGVEAGCLCSMDPEYMAHPDWQTGWVSLLLEPNGRVDVTEHRP